MSSSVVIFLVSHGLSGVETLALKKAVWYRRQGLDVFVASPFRNELHRAFLRSGARIFYGYYPSGRGFSPSANDHVVRFVRQSERAIRTHTTLNSIRFVEAFNPVGALMAEYASLTWGVPAVTGIVSTHGYDPGALGVASWKELSASFSGRNALHAMNEPCARSLEHAYGIPTASVPMFPLPLPSMPNVYAGRDRSYRLLSVGRLDPHKRYNLYMIDVVASLRKQYPGLSYTVIGSGALEDEMRRRVGALGLDDTVRILPVWPNDRFAELARSYDLFVGTGYSALELAMLGLPAILGPRNVGEDRPYTPGYVDEAEGYTVGETVGSQPVLVEDCVRDFLELDRMARERLSERVRAGVATMFGEESVMPRFVEFAVRAQPAMMRSSFEPSADSKRPSSADRLAAAIRNRAFFAWRAYRAARRVMDRR